MSGQPPLGAVSAGPGGPGNGPPGGSMGQQPNGGPSTGASTGGVPPGGMSHQNLNSIVIEYLSKKGFSRTEAMLRMESEKTDENGRPLIKTIEDSGAQKYLKAFVLLRVWIETSLLDIYKPELKLLLWPLYVHFFFNLLLDGANEDGKKFFDSFKNLFFSDHENDMTAFSTITTGNHVKTHETAKIYLSNRYRVPLSNNAYLQLLLFLEDKSREGGSVILSNLAPNIEIKTYPREAEDTHTLLALLEAGQNDTMMTEIIGIPGHYSGPVSGQEKSLFGGGPPKVFLGPLQKDPDTVMDIRADLAEEDQANPPAPGRSSLVDVFEASIKREEGMESPLTKDAPLPPSTARDVALEVQKIKENRDRYSLDTRTGGVAPGVSTIMYTFHNTYDSINCIDFSPDTMLVAAGMEQSYIRVWSLAGTPLTSTVKGDPLNKRPSSSRRLVGHSGRVFGVHFSPGAKTPEGADLQTIVPTESKHLLSCSEDKTIRLWSLETWHCLVIYKGHDQPVWDVQWGPFGHYFASCSLDKTALLWTTDSISPVRVFAGHESDVDCVAFHPNSAYVFTNSIDATVRMWSVASGQIVRIFTGHTGKGGPTSLACSPDGKKIASADQSGTILLWDIQSGILIKKMRGHGQGGIWSLSWSAESTLLVSGGADGTVRVWDINPPAEEDGAKGTVLGLGSGSQPIDGGGKRGAEGKPEKRKKDVVVTPDQVSAFPTKKTPVFKVRVSRQNLIFAAGCYQG